MESGEEVEGFIRNGGLRLLTAVEGGRIPDLEIRPDTGKSTSFCKPTASAMSAGRQRRPAGSSRIAAQFGKIARFKAPVR